jgi:tripartite-type tricarboxylate transporter receptor subunit TctC
MHDQKTPWSRAGGRMRRALVLSCAVLGLTLPVHSVAQEAWPSKPIRLVVPFAPGGASDIIARLLSKDLATSLKQPVVVDNRPGAAGTLGADIVAKSAPDGYTWLLGDISVVMTYPSLYATMPFQPKDLIPVANIATFGLIMVTAAESPIKSLKDVVTIERATPGKLNMASPGSGSSNHLTLEKFNGVAGTKLVHVPYKGAGPAIAGVVGGQVELTLISGAAAKPLLDGNKVRAIAVTSLDRVTLLPDVPTIAEQGFPGFESIAGQGLFVPAGTPPAIVKRINAEVMRILLSPEMQTKYREMGIRSNDQSPEQFAKWLDAETAQWSALIKATGIKAD